MLHSNFNAEITGHIDRPIRKLELRDGIGASFNVQATHQWTDEYGIPQSKTFWVSCVTFDTAWAGYILENFGQGSFVRVISKMPSIGTPRQGRPTQDGRPGKLYNAFDFIIDYIEDAREVNEAALADSAEVLAGVTAS